MNEQKLSKTIVENKIVYTLDEETQTYLPTLKVRDEQNEQQMSLSKYGRMREQYLKQYKPIEYSAMIVKGTLESHLIEVDQEAQRRLEVLMTQMKEAEDVTEQLKATDQMKWVGMMNNLKHSAEEIILNELIYG